MGKITYKYIFLNKIILSFLLLIVFFAIYFSDKNHTESGQNRVLFVVDISSDMLGTENCDIGNCEGEIMRDEALNLSGVKVWIKSMSKHYFSGDYAVGLLVFADNAELLLPFSSDEETFDSYLSSLSVNESGKIGVESGTVWDVISFLDMENVVFVSNFGFDCPVGDIDFDANISWIKIGFTSDENCLKKLQKEYGGIKYSFDERSIDSLPFVLQKNKIIGVERGRLPGLLVLLFVLLVLFL